MKKFATSTAIGLGVGRLFGPLGMIVGGLAGALIGAAMEDGTGEGSCPGEDGPDESRYGDPPDMYDGCDD